MSVSSTTSVPAPALGAGGFAAPAESDILTGVLSDMNAAFGGSLNTGLTTPQGQLASSLTAIIGDCNDAFVALANGVDPAFASGRMQDAIGRIYFMTRNPATATVVTGVCSGAAGTIIPSGALAQDAAGYRYAATSGGTIPATGTLSLQFACTTTGPVACPAGSLSVYQAVSGWNSVTNPVAGVSGSDVESRNDFEARRQLTVAGNSVGPNAAILASVLSVPGVTDAYVTDNSTPAAITTGGVAIAAHSVYVSVVGGDASAIALAILRKKPPGCGYSGGTTVTVSDPNAAYVTAPSYAVSFDYATPTPVFVAVSITSSAGVPSDALSLIQAAVTAAFDGTDGGTRARIASRLYASRFYTGIAALGTWAQIVEITIGTAAAPTGFTVQMDISQVPTLDPANITLALV
ncbi:baseplate J/gp47 family protein [Novacetimonas pomaceti]|uniref:baseplate J/gp47 family protein n=1 Tax=Novacetimonas pomaceti TaxID=2021998 RepID=UPI0030B91A61